MDAQIALKVFDALACQARFDIYRLLIRRRPQGLIAGELARVMDMAPSNLSFHLKHLVHAGLLDVQQEGRCQRYTANLSRMQALLGFLSDECCSDSLEACEPATVEALAILST